jgi:predicted nucleotidyltransferase
MTDSVIEICRDELSRVPEVDFAAVYGSCANGSSNAHSDVDIAVAGAAALDLEQRTRLSARLSTRLGREVDVIDLRSVTGVILQQALCSGKVLFTRDTQLYAALMKKLLYNQADMMPYYRRILDERRRRFLHAR